jgi:hypothetical protein
LTLSGHTATVTGLLFSPAINVSTLLEGGRARLFVIDVGELMALARSKVATSLNVEEYRQYLEEETCP